MKSIHHSFDIDLAEEYGLQESILIHHFQFWIRHNQKLNRNYYDGRTWMYQTLDEIAAHFPYWSRSEVYEIIEKLCTGKGRRSKKDELDFQPVLLKGNYNKSGYDRTTWYAFADEERFTILAQAKKGVGASQYGNEPEPTPIPNTKTDTKTKKFVAEDPAGSPPYKVLVGKNKDEEVTKDDMFSRAMKTSKSWDLDEMSYAWKVLSEYEGMIYDWWKFLEGTVRKYQNAKKSKRASGELSSTGPEHKSIKRGNGKCNNTIHTTSHTFNQETLDHDTKVQRWRSWPSLQDALNKYQNG